MCFVCTYTQLQKRRHRKMKKGKSQIGIISANLATFSWWIHLQPLNSALKFPVLLSFIFKTIANSNRKIRRPCADAANLFIRLISLIDSYLLFPFFHFSKTTLLQLGVYNYFNILGLVNIH